jgi:hypothetical protein
MVDVSPICSYIRVMEERWMDIYIDGDVEERWMDDI